MPSSKAKDKLYIHGVRSGPSDPWSWRTTRNQGPLNRQTDLTLTTFDQLSSSFQESGTGGPNLYTRTRMAISHLMSIKSARNSIVGEHPAMEAIVRAPLRQKVSRACKD
jgi:hypothetical protein